MAISQHDLQHLLSEYEGIVREANQSGEVGWSLLEARLIDTGNWSDGAAAELVSMVREYGSFMLRNAAALSLALGIDDGDCGF